MERTVWREWRSEHWEDNVGEIGRIHGEILDAFGEMDALGDRLLRRFPGRIERIEELVGLSFLRRLVTVFVGVRHLFENSAIEQAKILARSQFEILLSNRYLVHGAEADVVLETPTRPLERQERASYYQVAGLREEVYRLRGLLDGRYGERPISATDRARMEAEIQDRVQELEERYPDEHEAFGELRCLKARQNERGYYDRRRWYSFGFADGQVNSWRQLTERFGSIWVGQYEHAYRPFSALVHPVSFTQDIQWTDEGAELFSAYMADAFEFIAFWTLTWQALGLLFSVKAYLPDSLADAQQVYAKVRQATAMVEARLPMGYL